jgi:hypothetical protein
LPGELAAHGDRYDREIRLGGQTILHLHVQAGVLWASVPASGESEARPRVSIRGTADLDRVLDLVLRVLLERDRAGQNGARGNKSVVSFAEDAPRLQIQAHTPELSEKYSEELSEELGRATHAHARGPAHGDGSRAPASELGIEAAVFGLVCAVGANPQ